MVIKTVLHRLSRLASQEWGYEPAVLFVWCGVVSSFYLTTPPVFAALRRGTPPMEGNFTTTPSRGACHPFARRRGLKIPPVGGMIITDYSLFRLPCLSGYPYQSPQVPVRPAQPIPGAIHFGFWQYLILMIPMPAQHTR